LNRTFSQRGVLEYKNTTFVTVLDFNYHYYRNQCNNHREAWHGWGSEEDDRRGWDLIPALTNLKRSSGRGNYLNPWARTTRIHEPRVQLKSTSKYEEKLKNLLIKV